MASLIIIVANHRWVLFMVVVGSVHRQVVDARVRCMSICMHAFISMLMGQSFAHSPCHYQVKVLFLALPSETFKKSANETASFGDESTCAGVMTCEGTQQSR